MTHIEVRELVQRVGRLTRQWEVLTKPSEPTGVQAVLGYVEWLGRWRCYTFRPITHSSTWFEQVCLREIADFVEARTRAHRASRKAT